ncbi:MAG TPA: hypothetical protein VMV92_38275 [Streptosporangiaceae bacterium]|nr:hypothetical protein [Streptosporangiaceae bacterium]
MRFCTRCGAPVSGMLRYCTRCGVPIGQQLASGAPVSAGIGAQVSTGGQPETSTAAHPETSTGGDPQISEHQMSEHQMSAETEPAASTGSEPQTSAAGDTHVSVMPPVAAWLPGFIQIDDVPGDDPLPPVSPPSPSRRGTSSRGPRIAALVAAGVVAVGVGALLASNNHPTAARGGPARPSQARSAQPTVQHSRSPSPRASASAAASRPAAGRALVVIAPALADKAVAQQIAALLDSYFAAVNDRDYKEYSSLFELRHHLTAGQFTSGYRSTRDSDAALIGLVDNNRGLAATVTFQSQQNPAASPEHARCNDWRITLYLRRIGGVYLIGPPPPGYRALYHTCR